MPAPGGETAQPATATALTDPVQVVSDRAAGAHPRITATATGSPDPAGPRTVTIRAAALDRPTDRPITVHYTRDGSLPTVRSASFIGSAEFEVPAAVDQVIACCATDSAGAANYQAFPLSATP